jgi:hypothetical protein
MKVCYNNITRKYCCTIILRCCIIVSLVYISYSYIATTGEHVDESDDDYDDVDMNKVIPVEAAHAILIRNVYLHLQNRLLSFIIIRRCDDTRALALRLLDKNNLKLVQTPFNQYSLVINVRGTSIRIVYGKHSRWRVMKWARTYYQKYIQSK